MNDAVGRPLFVEVDSKDKVRVSGVDVSIVNSLRYCKNINYTKVKCGRSYKLLITQEVSDAIKLYQQNDGFAGLKLYQFIDRMFDKSGDNK